MSLGRAKLQWNRRIHMVDERLISLMTWDGSKTFLVDKFWLDESFETVLVEIEEVLHNGWVKIVIPDFVECNPSRGRCQMRFEDVEEIDEDGDFQSWISDRQIDSIGSEVDE